MTAYATEAAPRQVSLARSELGYTYRYTAKYMNTKNYSPHSELSVSSCNKHRIL